MSAFLSISTRVCDSFCGSELLCYYYDYHDYYCLGSDTLISQYCSVKQSVEMKKKKISDGAKLTYASSGATGYKIHSRTNTSLWHGANPRTHTHTHTSRASHQITSDNRKQLYTVISRRLCPVAALSESCGRTHECMNAVMSPGSFEGKRHRLLSNRCKAPLFQISRWWMMGSASWSFVTANGESKTPFVLI